MENPILVLLVASDDLCLETVAHLMTSRYAGLSIDTVNCVEDARDLLRNHHYDIVVCDLFFESREMPDLICEFCKAGGRKRVLIALTGNCDTAPECFGMKECCVQRILQKPVVLSDLFLSLDLAVEHAMRWKAGT